MRLGGASGGTEALGRSAAERASDRAFLVVSALLFAGSAALTIVKGAEIQISIPSPRPG
jgi:hypothetical protein